MVQIIREQSVTWPVDGPFEVVAPALSVTVQVSPTVARRRANAYLGNTVAMSVLAHNPRLVVGDRVVWRLDADLSLPDWGQIATLGIIDVDADTGDVLPFTPEQIRDLLLRADALASRLSHSPTANG